ncbi:MAG: hypothetical protein ABR556_14100, partial [Pyrinomonadaceae bacterium]
VLGGACFLLTSRTRKQVIVWMLIALIPTYLILIGPGFTRVTHQMPIRLLWIAALIVLVTLYRRKTGQHPGPRVAVAALATIAIYFAGLASIHVMALHRAQMVAAQIANRNAEQVVNVAA